MNKTIIISEFTFRAVRSSGSGGQHVNKVSTKVELYFDVINSKGLSAEQKETLEQKWSNRLNKEGVMKLSSQATRSQWKNREDVIEKFWKVFDKAFEVKKKRIATKRSKAQKEKRLKAKRIHSEKKAARKKLAH